MLTETEKKRIREEEIYRIEVTKELVENKPPPSRCKALIGFLNSALGIWLLSTVAVGFISWGYARIQDSNIRARANEETVSKLDVEIANRIRAFRRATADAKKKPELVTAIRNLDASTPVFVEYDGRSLYSLMWELSRKVPKDEAEKVLAPLRSIKVLKEKEIQLAKDEESTPIEQDKDYLVHEMEKSFKVRGWIAQP